MINELMNKIWDLKQTKGTVEKQVEELKEYLDYLEEELESLNKEILTEMVNDNLTESKDGDLVATLFTKTTNTYLNEPEVINYLKENNLTQYIKVTEKLDKKGLNSYLKSNVTLNESLHNNNLLGAQVTQYVVVTTAENTDKMMEHIKENTK